MNFRIYAYGERGPVYITTVYEEQYIELTVNKLDRDVYSSVLVIKHDNELDMDDVYCFARLEKIATKRRKR